MREITEIDELKGDGFWYVATPYTKYKDGLDRAYALAWDISSELAANHIRHYCPIAVTHDIARTAAIDPKDHSFWLGFDRPMMDRAKGLLIVKMDGWEESFGISYERSVFENTHRPILAIEPDVLLFGQDIEVADGC